MAENSTEKENKIDEQEKMILRSSCLARAAMVSKTTINNWSKRGLLPNRRDKRGYHDFSVEDLGTAIRLGKKPPHWKKQHRDSEGNFAKAGE